MLQGLIDLRKVSQINFSSLAYFYILIFYDRILNDLNPLPHPPEKTKNKNKKKKTTTKNKQNNNNNNNKKTTTTTKKKTTTNSNYPS